jgi:4-amino-4-deoxy-L-arabinose transferase-like glycosyltransferase
VRVIAGASIAGIIAVLLSAFGPRPQFTLDGYDYAIVMLTDRGIPYAQAQRQAAKFYATRPIAKNPQYARWLRGKPEYWELFSVRRVDSWIASLLYPWRGFQALIDVSRAAYVLVAMLVVVLAARFASVQYGVLSSVLLSLFPPWRDIARDSLTDPLAAALVTATLLAALCYLGRRTPWRLLSFTVLCGALTFTRPIAYTIVGAAVVAAIVALRRKDRQTAIDACWLGAVAALWTAVSMEALALAHAPSFGWIVGDTYGHLVALGYTSPGQTLWRWYLDEEFVIAGHGIRDALLGVVPIIAAAGAFLRRRRRETPILAGACGATWLGAVVDPNSFDMMRCVVMPVAPVVVAFAAPAIGTAVTFVPRLLGPATQALRLNLPGRPSLRKDTVKE